MNPSRSNNRMLGVFVREMRQRREAGGIGRGDLYVSHSVIGLIGALRPDDSEKLEGAVQTVAA